MFIIDIMMHSGQCRGPPRLFGLSNKDRHPRVCLQMQLAVLPVNEGSQTDPIPQIDISKDVSMMSTSKGRPSDHGPNE